MNLILLHGDNQVESRNKLSELKQKARHEKKEIIEIDAGKRGLTEVLQALEAQSLFSPDRLVVIENIYTSRKKNEDILNYIKNTQLTVDLVIWESKKIDGRKIGWIKKKGGRIENYLYPEIMFKFLESIGNPLKENTLKLFNELIKTQPAELVYYMIVRQFRLMLLVKSNSTTAKIKEAKRLQNWQIFRLKKQSENINFPDMLNSYKKLMYIDYQQKTGKSALDLKQTLDIFLSKV